MEKKNYLIVQKAGLNVFDVAYMVANKLGLSNSNSVYVDFYDNKNRGWSDAGVTECSDKPRIWAAQVYSITDTPGTRPTHDIVTYGLMINEEYEVYLTELEPIDA